MGFRTLEVSQPAEIHIKDNQLEIRSGDGVAMIPVMDVNHITAYGPI